MFDFFLPMTLKITNDRSSFFLYFFTIYVAKRHFPNVIRLFSWWCKSDVTSEKLSDVMYNVV